MSIVELILLAIGLSMDAFAVAICAGLTITKINIKKSLIMGLYFGGFQAGMPVIGFMVANLFADKIKAFDHWIAFALLVILGVKMIVEGSKTTGCPDRECPDGMCSDRVCPDFHRHNGGEHYLKPANMLPLALATSIDALAVGVSFAFLKVSIVPASAFIGITTLIISMAGMKIGSLCGTRFRSKAQLLGGAILILIGLKILLEHIGIVKAII